MKVLSRLLWIAVLFNCLWMAPLRASDDDDDWDDNTDTSEELDDDEARARPRKQCRVPEKRPLATKFWPACKVIAKVGGICYLALTQPGMARAQPTGNALQRLNSSTGYKASAAVNPQYDDNCYCSCGYYDCVYYIRRAEDELDSCLTSLGRREQALRDAIVDEKALCGYLVKSPVKFNATSATVEQKAVVYAVSDDLVKKHCKGQAPVAGNLHPTSCSSCSCSESDCLPYTYGYRRDEKQCNKKRDRAQEDVDVVNAANTQMCEASKRNMEAVDASNATEPEKQTLRADHNATATQHCTGAHNSAAQLAGAGVAGLVTLAYLAASCFF